MKNHTPKGARTHARTPHTRTHTHTTRTHRHMEGIVQRLIGACREHVIDASNGTDRERTIVSVAVASAAAAASPADKPSLASIVEDLCVNAPHRHQFDKSGQSLTAKTLPRTVRLRPVFPLEPRPDEVRHRPPTPPPLTSKPDTVQSTTTDPTTDSFHRFRQSQRPSRLVRC